ncbi:DUF3048 domain-containing protein [Clostridium amazonitimonense]|uniref:DUF3048 domain-containing protein n=1 Tax=Clostridium amazonitimonense TaxID=1499689 RepID=UPI000509B1E2|nr:DUF3048 domain-containing protein [Clostridium amazonitimonense]
MNKKLLLSLIIIVFLSGCGTSDNNTILNDNSSNNSLSLNTSSPKEESSKPLEKTYPFTGEPMTQENNFLPFMAIVENSKDSRPQSGLSKADIVFETMAEGGIPRFIALFHKESSKEIGPIRSLRPYFIEISEGFNLPFAHCGGSEDALNLIQSNNLMSLNEMRFQKSYWRDNSRKAPHNLYTSSDKITTLAKEKGYNKEPKSNIKFLSSYWDNKDLKECNGIKINMNKYYETSYTYENGGYKKFIGKDVFVDKSENKDIQIENIVIQQTTINLNKDNVHVDIPLIGEGTGYVLSKGKIMPMVWSRKDINNSPEIKDAEGNTIPLHPGKTWWNIIDKSNEIVLY